MPQNLGLWLTYAHVDDQEGDFSYLVQELESVGIAVRYDRRTIIPGFRMWEQIGDQIMSGPYAGWAYLVTPNGLRSQACREELEYALVRALGAKGGGFPLIGLLHRVSPQDLPPSLRVRLCVELGNPKWKEEVLAGLRGQPPQDFPAPQSDYVLAVHNPYLGDPRLTAVEIRPRFGELTYWRILVPSLAVVKAWGHGPADGKGLSGIRTNSAEGTATVEGSNFRWFGSGDRLTSSTSAYIVFEGMAPKTLGFGTVKEAFAPPSQVQVIRIGP